MKTRILMTILGMTTVALATSQLVEQGKLETKTNPDGTSYYVAKRDNVQIFEVLGVLAMDETKISCWDMNGTISASLTAKVTDWMNTRAIEVGIKRNKKNRSLIIKRLSTNNYSYFRSGTDYITSHSILSNENESIELLDINASPESTKYSLYYEISKNEFELQSMEAKVGASLNLLNTTYRITAFSFAPMTLKNSKNYVRLLGKSWIWTTDIAVEGELKESSYFMWPLDDTKTYIQYVDRMGNPVSQAEYMKDPEPEATYIRSENDEKTKRKSKYLRAIFYNKMNMGPKEPRSMSTNINPSKIKYIEIYHQKVYRIEINDIPLDPK